MRQTPLRSPLWKKRWEKSAFNGTGPGRVIGVLALRERDDKRKDRQSVKSEWMIMARRRSFNLIAPPLSPHPYPGTSCKCVYISASSSTHPAPFFLFVYFFAAPPLRANRILCVSVGRFSFRDRVEWKIEIFEYDDVLIRLYWALILNEDIPANSSQFIISLYTNEKSFIGLSVRRWQIRANRDDKFDLIRDAKLNGWNFLLFEWHTFAQQILRLPRPPPPPRDIILPRFALPLFISQYKYVKCQLKFKFSDPITLVNTIFSFLFISTLKT